MKLPSDPRTKLRAFTAAALVGLAAWVVLALLVNARCATRPAVVSESKTREEHAARVEQHQEQRQEQRATATHRVQRVVILPDGRREETTTTDTTTAAVAASSSAAVHVERLDLREESRRDVRALAMNRLKLSGSWALRLAAPDPAPSDLSLEYERRIAGPCWLGASIRGTRTPRLALAAGVSLAWEW